MLDLGAARKNKITLSDYDVEQDIANRILMSDFSPLDLTVLEEILYSPLKISPKKMARAIQVTDEELDPILKKLAAVGLLSETKEGWLVDKELRKYFEFQLQRFDPSFKPDMEFAQGLLKKVPIHVLPVWYSIPRSSNNIFQSIVEKYLLTVPLFQRYLQELNFGDPRIDGIIETVHRAETFQTPSSDLIAKYNLSRREFEEILLLLEFNFVCCVRYSREEDHWVEVVTPFAEWEEYLRHLKKTEPKKLPLSAKIVQLRDKNFPFVEDLSLLLKRGSQKKIPALLAELPSAYLSHLSQKLSLVELASDVNGTLKPTEIGHEWLEMSLENRALYLYRHPKNQILSYSLDSVLASDKNLREAEKAIKRVLHGQWILFDDFVKGALVSFNGESGVTLKLSGKHWKYEVPHYSKEEQELLRAVIFEWLFEAGMVNTGTYEGEACFQVTPFGRFFFED